MAIVPDGRSGRGSPGNSSLALLIAGLGFVVVGLGITSYEHVSLWALPAGSLGVATVALLAGVVAGTIDHLPVLGPAFDRHQPWLLPAIGFLALTWSISFATIAGLAVAALGFGAGVAVSAGAVVTAEWRRGTPHGQ